MFAYVVKRLISGVLVVTLVSMAIFLLFWYGPSSPARTICDNETGNHIRRTQLYVKALAKRLQSHAKYGPMLDDRTIEMLHKSAPLHDIGKVGIPDAILMKAGKHTPQEFEVMKTHTILGRNAILEAEKVDREDFNRRVIAREVDEPVAA